jgi:hypothetical protein
VSGSLTVSWPRSCIKKAFLAILVPRQTNTTRRSILCPLFRSRLWTQPGLLSPPSKRNLVPGNRGRADWVLRLVNSEFQTPRNGRKNDKAHPPIHPTAAALNLDADERRVYELVTRRFLASCHSNAEGKTTTVEADIAGEIFTASGELCGAHISVCGRLKTQVSSYCDGTTSRSTRTTSGTEILCRISRKESSSCPMFAS